MRTIYGSRQAREVQDLQRDLSLSPTSLFSSCVVLDKWPRVCVSIPSFVPVSQGYWNTLGRGVLWIVCLQDWGQKPAFPEW